MTDEKQKNAFLRKIANAEDEATGDAFEVFKFNKPLGATARIRVRRADARNPTKLMETLLSSNWDALAADDQAKAMVRAAIEAEPQKHWLFAAHVGFRDELSNFIFPDGVVGENTGPRVLKPPLWAEATMQLSRRGSLEEWIQKVAQPCKFSSRLMLLVSCGFAAPILPVAGLQPFAVLVYGKPKSGKTTAILVAASIIGIGAESRLLNFNMTDAALLERARFLNNQCVPVNETGALKGDKKYAYPKLRTTIYTFAEGQDTLRHSGSSYATPASSSTWAGILLAN